jgi:hypothetical protein
MSEKPRLPKPRLISIREPLDAEVDRADLSRPYPIERGGHWYVDAEEKKAAAEHERHHGHDNELRRLPQNGP